MSYIELIVALENIIIDKVATVPTTKSRKYDTSAPMEIGMTAKEGGESMSQEGDQRIVDLAMQAVYKGTGKGKWGFGKGQSWNEKRGKGSKMEERSRGRKAAATKEAKGKRKVGRNKNMLDVRQDRTHCSLVKRRQQKSVRHR